MPQSALTRLLAVTATVGALMGALLAAPTAQAADNDRLAPASTVSRAVLADRALVSAEQALAGRGGNATLALRDLALLRDSLSPAEQARAAKLSARPATNRVDCSSKVACIHWQTGETTGPWAKLVKATTTKVGTKYKKAGYRTPKKDGSKGGNKKPDIYVDNLQPGLYGYCTIDNGTQQPGPGRYDVPAFCVVDNNYKGFPRTPKQNLQVTVAHEYFHAVQFAYDFYEDSWLMEATAAWVEDEMFPSVNDNYQYLKYGQLAKPNVSMDKFAFASYGHWIFFRYLSEKFKKSKKGIPTIVLDIWKAADSKGGSASNQFSVQAINTALVGRGTTFATEFAKFNDANRRSRSVYKEGKKLKYPVAPLARTDTLSSIGAGGTLTATLKQLTSATLQLKSSGIPSGAGLAMNFNLGDAVTGAKAVVTTYRKSGGPVTVVVSLDAAGNGSYEAAFGSDAVSSVEVTLNNGSGRYSSCYTFKTRFACGGGKQVDKKVAAAVQVQVVA